MGPAGAEGREGGTAPGVRASPGSSSWDPPANPSSRLPGLSQRLQGLREQRRRPGHTATAEHPFPPPPPSPREATLRARSREAGRRQRLLSELPRAEQSEPGRKHKCKRRLPLGGRALFLPRHRRGQRQATLPRACIPGANPRGVWWPLALVAPWPGACGTPWQPSAHPTLPLLGAGTQGHEMGRQPGRVPSRPHPRPHALGPSRRGRGGASCASGPTSPAPAGCLQSGAAQAGSLEVMARDTPRPATVALGGGAGA